MVLSVKLAEGLRWSNFLWEKLVKIVSCFLLFLKIFISFLGGISMDVSHMLCHQNV